MISNIDRMNDTSNGGFLCGFVEANVEMPPDGLNGDCVIHYEGDHSKYELMVKLVNGVREGKAIILYDGVPTLRCEYRNGVVSGNMDELDEWESLLLGVSVHIDPSVLINCDDGILSYDNVSISTCGVLKFNELLFAIDWWNDSSHVVLADLNTMEMFEYVNSKRIDTQCSKEVIDLDANGRRWEGGVRDGKPFGYGLIYDEEGMKEYEGFMMDGAKTCYGVDYCNGISRMKYEGFYYNNSRFGKGTLYDRNGSIDYDGLWKNNEPYSPQSDGATIDNHTESVVIPNRSFNELKSFIIPSFTHSLRRIVIGDECFESVRLFELAGLTELESVVIGRNSFKLSGYIRTDGTYRVVNCPKLKSIAMGHEAFDDYHSFELNNLPSLRSIEIGANCFYWTPSFSLIGLIDWTI